MQRSAEGSVRRDFLDQTCFISPPSSVPRQLSATLSTAIGTALDVGLVWPKELGQFFIVLTSIIVVQGTFHAEKFVLNCITKTFFTRANMTLWR